MTRITNILDIVEPRVKPDGLGDIFPGFLGSSEKVGNGITKVLEGAAVVEVAAIPRVQEGLIDMGGTGAQYSPFSQTHNVSCYALSLIQAWKSPKSISAYAWQA